MFILILTTLFNLCLKTKEKKAKPANRVYAINHRVVSLNIMDHSIGNQLMIKRCKRPRSKKNKA